MPYSRLLKIAIKFGTCEIRRLNWALILVMSDLFFRDIYYSDVVFFGSQSVVDEIIDNLACMLKVPRHCLHVVSVTHRSLSLTKLLKWFKILTLV